MAGERDVLAEAQAFLDEARVLVEPSPEYDDWLVRAPAVIRSLFAATFSALATLSKSAPDRHVVTLADSEPDHDDASDWFGPQEPSALAIDLRAARELAERILSRPSSRKPSEVRLAQVVLAQPIPEPLPREALDVERLKRAMADHEIDREVAEGADHCCDFGCARPIATAYAALSPDRPTPP